MQHSCEIHNLRSNAAQRKHAYSTKSARKRYKHIGLGTIGITYIRQSMGAADADSWHEGAEFGQEAMRRLQSMIPCSSTGFQD